MGAPSNPGWTYGYVPSPGEWNNTFAGKADYPVPVDQGGTGGQNAAVANNALQLRQLLADNATLGMFYAYGVRTSVGAFALTLPLLASVSDGDWIDVYDVDFNAAANEVTVNAAGGNTISLYGSAASSQTLNVSGFRVRLVANQTSWSMIV